MRRLLFLLPVLMVCAGTLSAERIVDFGETVYLQSYETVRYRIPFDYGTATHADIRIVVRGFDAPPRARLLNADFGLAKESRDTSHDGIIDFTHRASEPRYYLEVDSAHASNSGDFEIRVLIDAEDGADAWAQVEFVKYFHDHEGDHDHNCSTGESQSGWLGALAAMAAGLWLLRRRLA
ncbi:MAG: hypothetical protein KBG84_11165 [Planctomycetes bacterium]|nr:hypothetical protein [Planctomycetota bacterium]